MVVSREGRAVEQFLAAMSDGTSGLIIEGDPGIGKTTLWRSVCQDAEAVGFHVLSCRPGAAEVSLSFTAVSDLLADVGPPLLDQLPAVQRDALNAVLLRGPASPHATDDRTISAAVGSLLALLARDAPLLIAIDDAQWLDSSSRAVLAFVVRRLHGRIGILAAARTGHDLSDGTGWIRLPRDDALVRIRLQPMTIGALSTVVSERLGRPLARPAMVRVTEISGGNPFYAIELAKVVSDDARDLPTALPDSLTAVVRSRVSHLADGTHRLLLAAASTAEPTVALRAAACDVSLDEAVTLLETAEHAGIIDIDARRVVFTHPLLSTGVYSDASRPQRRAMHRRLAAVVEQPELRARHLALAATSNDSATVEALDAAAEATRVRGAPAAAAELLEMAIKLGGDTPVRRLQAAEQHFRAGALAQARMHLDSALDGMPSGTLRCMALMLLAAVEGYGDNLAAAVDALRAGVDEADEPSLRLQALMLLVPTEGIRGDVRASVEIARAAVELADQVGIPGPRSQARTIWVMVNYLYGLGVDHAALDAALADEKTKSRAAATFQATAVAAAIAGMTGDLEPAHAAMSAVQQRLTDLGSEDDILWAAGHVVMFELWLGRYSDAEHTARDALQRAEQMGGMHALTTTSSGVAAVAAYTGDVDGARTAARRALDAAHRLGADFMLIAPTATLVFLEVSLGRYDDAVTTAKPLMDGFDPAHDTEIWVGGWLPDAIESLCATGRIDDATNLAKALESNGTKLDRAWMLAVGARGRALCLAARGDVDDALLAVETALAHHDRLPIPFERARTLLLKGQLQRRTRQKAAAAATLDQARSIFGELGAPLWTARADAERDRVHVGAVKDTALTPTESRIAELAAAGKTNRDIAARLFISVKTVEAAISRIYRKLEIRSRAELARRLAQR